ncbi:glutamate--tRNA ligase family protein [Sulfurimonas paralvinellae]|uniref:Glutamate--tRNA ligase n=1 Tax=Sulfurimonas paralvinellae TaxID=317658 RepID=A0A7M1B7G9_9BACT|nr:glutamate--tRNA ligase family protein [Sulfurimonas paralvinellae]QOP45689.1 glutamate--tRNA ligase [Sulfurimonas paralvinellae]
MLRYAPDSQGEMNINDLRTALLNYIVSKQRDENFAIVIDDEDRQSPELLTLFSLEYSQIISKSQNARFHAAMALQLLHEKKAFNCFCSDEWIEKKRQEAHEAGKPYMYDDACANLPAELVIDNEHPFVVRIKRPESSNDSNSFDSFIILNRDKTSTPDFAAAVDDMLSDISFVITDEKNKINTLKQEHIRKQLGYNKTIEYVYIPEITGEELPTITSLLEEGFLPEAISNYLVSTVFEVDKEIFTLDDAIEFFDIDSISKSSEKFDKEQLKKINREHLRKMSNKELSRYVGFADADIGGLAKLYLDKVSTTKELKEKIKPVFETREVPQKLAKHYKEVTQVIKEDESHYDTYDAFANMLEQRTGLEESELAKIMSILLTNSQDAPELPEVYKHLKNYIGEIIKK